MKPGQLLTTMLFVPGTATDKFANLPKIASRAFILDLEDAVPPKEKEAARANVAQLLDDVGEQLSLHVRVNPIDSDYFISDLDAVVRSGLAGIDIPKVTSAADIIAADAVLTALERRAGLPAGQIELMATIETATGVRNVYDIAGAGTRLRRLCFGAGDFTLDLGLDWPDDSGLTSATLVHAKVQMVMASRLSGLEPPHDSSYPVYTDLDGLRREADESRRLGFVGKHAIHPAQLSVIEETYRPSLIRVERAKRIVEAFERAEANGQGAIGLGGELIDYPILDRARQILAEAQE
jgi:citrate lyase subunit beta/citryl-CoA lyase